MYHEERKITIFSKHQDLEEQIRKVMKAGPIVYHIFTVSLLQEGWTDSDIVVCDIPVKELAFYRRKMKTEAYLIYICDPDCDICADKENMADELICRPVSGIYFQKRIEKICGCIRHREDAWLSAMYLDVLIDSMPDLVWFKDNDGIHLKVNKVFCHTVGKDCREIVGKNHCEVWDVSVDDCEKTERIVRQKRKTCQFKELVQSRNGMRQFRTYKTPLFDQKGEIMGTVGIGHDETDIQNMSTEMEILLSSMPYAILVKDQDGIIVNVNQKFEEYFDTSKNDMTGKFYDSWYSHIFLGQESRKKNGIEELCLASEDGIRVMELSHEPVYDIFQNDVGELCIYRDVTEEYKLKEQLNSNSNTDFLTGLCNRRHFYECFTEGHSYEQISLLYVDLDHFKSINDTYGHQIGDAALITVADTLKKCFPEDLITRLGGDEFLVSKTKRISEAELIRQANALIASLKEAFSHNICFKALSASVGIAYTEQASKKIDTLIKESDSALYKAKQTGKSKCCVFDGE